MLTDTNEPRYGLKVLTIAVLAIGFCASLLVGMTGGAQAGVLAFLFVLAMGFLIAATTTVVALTVLDVRRAAGI